MDNKKFILVGAIIGIGAVTLSYFGNPANTGICVSCFMRNVSGAIGLHDNVRMQYLRPEIPAFVLGAFIASLIAKDFKSISGSSPLLRFFAGVLLIVGCSVFIGCPIKMVLRVSAGDLSAIAGVIGLVSGVWIGLKFLEGGFRLGEPSKAPLANGLIIPIMMFIFLGFLIFKSPFINFSSKGSAALHAPVWLSLAIGLLIGYSAQRSGFCITGGFARLFLWGPKEVKGCPKSTGLLLSIGSLFIAAMLASMLTGQFSLGLHGQPSSNESYLWNFLGLLVVGFGSVLVKGCPLRQLVLSGQGDSDAGAAVMGMFVGATLVQKWGIAGTSAGTPFYGKIAVISALIFLVAAGLLYRDRDTGLAPEFQRGLD